MYRVCIADDESYVQKSIIQRIANCGVELELGGTAVNGLEAELLYEKQKPDIFFVDINMPIIDGLDFIARVRKQDSETRTRFVIISGYDDFAYMKKAIRMGVVNYIKKPIQKQEFNEMIREICQQLEADRMKAEQEDAEDIWTWPDFLENEVSGRFCGTLLMLRKMQAGKESGIFLKALRRIGGGNTDEQDAPSGGSGETDREPDWQAIVFGKEVPDILLLFRENRIMTEKEIWQISEMEEFREIPQIVYFSGKYHSPEELISGFEDVLNLRFYHADQRLMKFRDVEHEKISISYEAFDAALENIRENKYGDCIGLLVEPLFADVKFAYLLKQVYQSMILVIANKYMKYDLPLPVRIRQELFPFAISAYRTKQELRNGLEEYAYELNQKIILLSKKYAV